LADRETARVTLRTDRAATSAADALTEQQNLENGHEYGDEYYDDYDRYQNATVDLPTSLNYDGSSDPDGVSHTLDDDHFSGQFSLGGTFGSQIGGGPDSTDEYGTYYDEYTQYELTGQRADQVRGSGFSANNPLGALGRSDAQINGTQTVNWGNSPRNQQTNEQPPTQIAGLQTGEAPEWQSGGQFEQAADALPAQNNTSDLPLVNYAAAAGNLPRNTDHERDNKLNELSDRREAVVTLQQRLRQETDVAARRRLQDAIDTHEEIIDVILSELGFGEEFQGPMDRPETPLDPSAELDDATIRSLPPGVGDAFANELSEADQQRLKDVLSWGWQITYEDMTVRHQGNLSSSVSDGPDYDVVEGGGIIKINSHIGGLMSKRAPADVIARRIKAAIYDKYVNSLHTAAPPESVWAEIFSDPTVSGTVRIFAGAAELAGGVTLVVSGGGAAAGVYFIARGLDEVVAGFRQRAGDRIVRSGVETIVDGFTEDQTTTDKVIFWFDLGTAGIGGVKDIATGTLNKAFKKPKLVEGAGDDLLRNSPDAPRFDKPFQADDAIPDNLYAGVEGDGGFDFGNADDALQDALDATNDIDVPVGGGKGRKNTDAPKGFDVASQAAKGFKNLECKECVAAIVKEMKAKGLSGEIIDLSTDVNRPFIYSDRFGGVISQNGTHQAVRIGDTVFDNLNPNGIPYGEWLKDLHSVQGFDIKVTPF